VALPLVIVGGHSHTRVEKPVRIGACAVLQAWEHGKVLGLADVTVDNRKLVSIDGRLVEIHPDQGQGNREVQAVVDRYNQEVNAILGRQVGSAEVDLVQQGVRQQETNFGDLVADIIRKETGAQAALINGGSIRTGIPRGAVTARQIYAALPFNSYLVAVKMTGSQLLETLEHGVSGIENGEGRFPQVSGIRFAFDSSLPVGKRVRSVVVDGKPLNPAEEYTVATLDFIAAGGDGYTAFGRTIRSSGDFSEVAGAMKSSRLVYNDPGRFLRDVVIETLGRETSIKPVTDGRIIRGS
jgi:2',3'-cyclic-nucleotide 2'-phosphodiesterase (5'-nucleotidase family)